MNTFEFDKTEAVRQSLAWLVNSELQRKLQDAYDRGETQATCLYGHCHGNTCSEFQECVKTLNLSPQMRTAAAIQADLNSGHIKCLRDTQTNDY